MIFWLDRQHASIVLHVIVQYSTHQSHHLWDLARDRWKKLPLNIQVQFQLSGISSKIKLMTFRRHGPHPGTLLQSLVLVLDHLFWWHLIHLVYIIYMLYINGKYQPALFGLISHTWIMIVLHARKLDHQTKLKEWIKVIKTLVYLIFSIL